MMTFICGFLYPLFYFSLGGIGYYFIEIIYRGHSHYSMFLCGGIVFYLISLFNKKYEHTLHLITRMIFASLIILFVELIFGIIFNLIFHQNIWNYSDQYYNWKGQICLTFSILWFFLTLPVFFLDSFLRSYFFSKTDETVFQKEDVFQSHPLEGDRNTCQFPCFRIK